MKSLAFICLLTVSLVGVAKDYRLFEDPKRSSASLAKWNVPAPLTSSHWLQLVGNLRYQSYRIRKGDTLSRVSKRMFGKMEFWPKLWEVNQELFGNPHVIEVGQLLTFYREEASRKIASAPEVVKLRPEGGRAREAHDLEKDSILAAPLQHRHRLKFFLMGDDEYLGMVTGSFLNRRYFQGGDDIYIGAEENQPLMVGESYSLVREEAAGQKKVREAGAKKGELMRLVGEVKILEKRDHLYAARVTGAFHPIMRGDHLVKLPSISTTADLIFPPEDMTARIVLGDEVNTTQFVRGQLVLLNRGSDLGMRDGYLFRVFDDVDPRFESPDSVEPESKGEIQVVFVGKLGSVGYVRSSRSPLKIGDALVPAQTFSDPVKSPRRSSETIEF